MIYNFFHILIIIHIDINDRVFDSLRISVDCRPILISTVYKTYLFICK